MHFGATKTNTTAPPRMRVAIAVAFLALCALILGLAAPPANADTGQQIVLVNSVAPPPDVGTPANNTDTAAPATSSIGTLAPLDTSPQIIGVGNSNKNAPTVNLDTSPPTASVAVNNPSATVNASPQNQTVVANQNSNVNANITPAAAANVNGNGTLVSNEPAIVNERTALGPESALTRDEIIVSIEQTLANERMDCSGTELATSSLITDIANQFAPG